MRTSQTSFGSKVEESKKVPLRRWMQEPTQKNQNEQMDSLVEMGAQEHREQRRGRLNETLSSEMSKRPVVKATPAHSPTIAPMMESFGSTVPLDPAPLSKDEVVCMRSTESTLWQLLSRGRCVADRRDENVRAREIQFQDGEQESDAIVDHEDPSVSKTINVFEARMGEKLDSEETLFRKAKAVQEFDEFEVKMKVDKSEARMTPRKKVW